MYASCFVTLFAIQGISIMNYYEFMFAFCNKPGIDLEDFENTLNELLKRNGVYLTPMQHYNEAILGITEPAQITYNTDFFAGALENEDYKKLKSFKLIVSDKFDKISTLMYRLQILVDLFGVDTENQKEIIYNIELTVEELHDYCKTYKTIIDGYY